MRKRRNIVISNEKREIPKKPEIGKSKLWIELEEGTEILIVPGGAIMRSTSETTESMVFIPGPSKKLLCWAEEILPAKE